MSTTGGQPWSLGSAGDILWQWLPEARPMVVEVYQEELRTAVRHTMFLGLPVGDLASALYYEVFEPALDVDPLDEEFVARCLDTLLRLFRHGSDGEWHWSAFGDAVLVRAKVKERSALMSRLHSECWDFFRRASGGEPGLFPKPDIVAPPPKELPPPPPGAMTTFQTVSGPAAVPAAGLIGQFLDPEANALADLQTVYEGRMWWSLGAFGDLLWMLVPESREYLAELGCRELAAAAAEDRPLELPADHEVARRLRVDVILPAHGEDLLGRCFGVLRRLLAEHGDRYRPVIDAELLDPLRANGRVDVARLIDPDSWPHG